MSSNQRIIRKKVPQLTYPLHLQIKGKPCLVIGGGKIAQRKTEKLINCRADVTLIAKSLTAKLQKMSDSGRISAVNRAFRTTDLNRRYQLVFAATNDSALNKKITDLCNEKNILICSVDANWVDGSFITPASFSQDGLTVSVASGGTSCRRSKLLKKNIHKHFTALELSELLVLGTDHNCLTLKQREKIHPDPDQLYELGGMLNGISALHEFFILNTCNRFEVITVAHNSDILVATLKKLMGFDKLDKKSYYMKSGFEAFKHTSLLASGIISQNTGETYIAAQLKDALKTAKQHDWCDGIIQDWIDKSLHISKDIRNGLLLSGNKDIDELIADYLPEHVSGLKNKTLAILGSGKIGKAVYKSLKNLDFKKIKWFYKSRKPGVKTGHCLEVLQLDSLDKKISDVDILVTALNSAKPVIDSEMLKKLDKKRRIFIDLGIPRNIEISEKSANIAINILDLNHLQNDISPKQFAVLKDKASMIVDEHKEMFIKLMDSLK